MKTTIRISAGLTLLLCDLVMAQIPDVAPPGTPWKIPDRATSPEAPMFFEHTQEAGPDETFLATGQGLGEQLVAWGASDSTAEGEEFLPRVCFANGQYVSATIPQRQYDGVFLVWARNGNGYSKPIVLNAAAAWWLMSDKAAPGDEISIFGRNLARRPDFDRAYVYAQGPGQGQWLTVTQCGKYRLRVRIPADARAGTYRLWCHTGSGGPYGWSAPLALRVAKPAAGRQIEGISPNGAALLEAIGKARSQGGPAAIVLPAGLFEISTTLKVPAGAVLRAQGRARRSCPSRPATPKAYRLSRPTGWNVAPGGLGNAGDEIDYAIDAPADGNYALWLRYACDLSWGQRSGMSKDVAVSVDSGEAILLDNLPNTMGYEWYTWSKAATVPLSRGKYTLTWRNIEGGSINMDAMVLSCDAALTPSDKSLPAASEKVIVIQAESPSAVRAEGFHIPGTMQPAVWLCGDGAGLVDLSVQGSSATDVGVLIRDERFPRWVEDCQVRRVHVTGVEGKRNDNRTVVFQYAHRAAVEGCELWGRADLHGGRPPVRDPRQPPRHSNPHRRRR